MKSALYRTCNSLTDQIRLCASYSTYLGSYRPSNNIGSYRPNCLTFVLVSLPASSGSATIVVGIIIIVFIGVDRFNNSAVYLLKFM